MTKTTAKTEVSSKMSRDELLATVAGFEFHTVEIIGGKKFPIGEKFDCIKVGVSKWNKPYTVILVDGEDTFCNPANLKALKPLAPAKVALIKASLEEAGDAVLMLSGTVRNESERAVLIKHHGWFKPVWFPKNLVTALGDHEDGVQTIFEVPAWKIKADHGPNGIAALEALQSGFEKMLAPKAVTGKTTVIKKKS